MSTGADLRNEGQDAVIAADVAVHRMHADYIREALDGYARWGRTPWTCDDVRRTAKELAEHEGVTFDPAPNLLPALIGVAVGKGEIVRQPVDARSGRRSRRASRVGTYLGARFTQTPSALPLPAEVEEPGEAVSDFPCCAPARPAVTQ